MPAPWERVFDDGATWIALRAEPSVGRLLILIAGCVHREATERFAATLDRVLASAPAGRRLTVLIDARRATGAALRGQLAVGKTVVLHRRKVGRAVVIGARPLVRRMTAAVAHVAHIDDVLFVADEAAAAVALGWAPDLVGA